MTSRPRVYTRIRPQNDNEIRQGGQECLHSQKGEKEVLIFKKDNEEMKTRFDYVFDPNATQDEVYEHIHKEVMSTLFNGYNASIFAYGQTGSGKTYTMEGDHYNAPLRGVIPRLIETIFAKFKSDSNITDSELSCSFVQIYQEKIQDLFCGCKQLEIHMDRTGQYIAQGAVWKVVRTPAEALELYFESVKQRATSSTDMNLVSSRSHTILMLKLFWDEPSLPGSRAQLNLIDLAGSEKLYQSHATGEVMKETIHINKSLSALGNVVHKLVDQVKNKDRRIHIPYKDSKLTYLLQSSLGGSNLVHFILALSSSSLWCTESTSTIEFGKRALQLVIRPVRNPIDYKRLEEMEAMIEKMRSHIRSLEEELRTKPQQTDNTAFLQLQRLYQEGEEKKKFKGEKHQNTKNLKTKTELNRIIQNLPETLEDLTSHCVLFPQSKVDFRLLGGIEKLVNFIDKSQSTFHRAHAAHTISNVIDDEGRVILGNCGGIEALGRLMLVNEERCKEAGCIGLEAAVRNFNENKDRITQRLYEILVSLFYQNKNQQVQEAACTCLATIVDNYEKAKRVLTQLSLVPKLVNTIRNAPPEVVHVTKAATTCVGRIAHGDPQMQAAIAKEDGISVLINDVLFSTVGERDHQVPMLASYALVNLCCSNKENMAIARKNPRYEQVQYKLLEGLARAFGNNTVREGFGRATAEETHSPFPYYGITIMGKWDALNCGGRPIFSTFMENPQYYLYINEDTKLSLLIQDTLYEFRTMQKQHNNTVYMGLAVFEADPDLTKLGLKQIDFHGRLLDIAKFTSNCENILHCELKKSEIPYVLVPFTSQCGRSTNFAISAFANNPVEMTPLSETTGWVRNNVDGCWTSFTGKSSESFEWRCNSQVRIKVKETCHAVFVLTYLSLDQQRRQKSDESEEEKHNPRPRLHGRVFLHNFAPEKRYVKAICPLPEGSTFVAANNYSSNSYTTTSTMLQAGQTYAYIPYTDTPYEDTWRLRLMTDSDEVEVAPMSSPEVEWCTVGLSGNWPGRPISVTLQTTGRITVIINSEDTFVRLSLADNFGQRIDGIDSFWKTETNIEHVVKTPSVGIVAEGVVKHEDKQTLASGNPFDLFIFSENPITILDKNFTSSPSAIKLPTVTCSPSLLQYPKTSFDQAEKETPDNDLSEDSVNYEDDDDNKEEALQATMRADKLQSEVDKHIEENKKLQEKVKTQEDLINSLRSPASPSSSVSSPASITSMNGLKNNKATGRKNSSLKIPPITPTSRADPEKVIDDVVVRLHTISQIEKAPTQAEWIRLKKDLKDCQSKLTMSKPH